MRRAHTPVSRQVRSTFVGFLFAVGALSAGGCAAGNLEFSRPQLQPGSDMILPVAQERSLLRTLLDPCVWRDSASLRSAGLMRCGAPALDSVTVTDNRRPATQKVP